MENVVLIVHLLLALALIGIVLMQRSEGGGLGMGGGGGVVSGRAAATAMGKLTWILAIAFIITSLTLTVLAAQKTAGASVLDRIGNQPVRQAPEPTPDAVPSGESLLPPAAGDTGPLVPSAD